MELQEDLMAQFLHCVLINMDPLVVYICYLAFYERNDRYYNRVLSGTRVEMDLYSEVNYALSWNDM